MNVGTDKGPVIIIGIVVLVLAIVSFGFLLLELMRVGVGIKSRINK